MKQKYTTLFLLILVYSSLALCGKTAYSAKPSNPLLITLYRKFELYWLHHTGAQTSWVSWWFLLFLSKGYSVGVCGTCIENTI